MKLYITRHGETQWNLEGRLQGWSNSSQLSEKGILDAKRLGEYLKEVNFDCIYTSPLDRAIKTAELIRGDKDIPIIQCEGLKEINFGDWEGKTYSEIDTLYKEQHNNFWNHPELYKPVGGESYDELIYRVRKALTEISEANQGANVLIVTHGVTKKAIYKIVKDLPMEEFWAPPRPNNTSLSIVEVDSQRMSFILEADISHLDEDE